MSQPLSIFIRAFVRPFYRENAGLFIFVFIMMFYIVGEADGAGLVEYHYSLIMGTLTSAWMLALVLFLWLLYARKSAAFVSKQLADPRYSFTQIYNCIDKQRRLRLLVIVEVLLLLPVLLYSIAIITIGLSHGFYMITAIIVIFLSLLVLLSAWWHRYRLSDAQLKLFSVRIVKTWPGLPQWYPFILFRFVARHQKMIWIAIKIFTCGILYVIARNNILTSSDINTVFLFYNFGVLGNGIILYRVREFEETQLRFYRTAPIPVVKRFFQYGSFYFGLLIPEFIVAAVLAPGYLTYQVAISFSFCAYALLLLMNTISFLQDFSMRDYLKIIMLVFSMQYIFIVTGAYLPLAILFIFLAFVLFLFAYYRFEKTV